MEWVGFRTGPQKFDIYTQLSDSLLVTFLKSERNVLYYKYIKQHSERNSSKFHVNLTTVCLGVVSLRFCLKLRLISAIIHRTCLNMLSHKDYHFTFEYHQFFTVVILMKYNWQFLWNYSRFRINSIRSKLRKSLNARVHESNTVHSAFLGYNDEHPQER